jgi:hypothetical protein
MCLRMQIIFLETLTELATLVRKTERMKARGSCRTLYCLCIAYVFIPSILGGTGG